MMLNWLSYFRDDSAEQQAKQAIIDTLLYELEKARAAEASYRDLVAQTGTELEEARQRISQLESERQCMIDDSLAAESVVDAGCTQWDDADDDEDLE